MLIVAVVGIITRMAVNIRKVLIDNSLKLNARKSPFFPRTRGNFRIFFTCRHVPGVLFISLLQRIHKRPRFPLVEPPTKHHFFLQQNRHRRGTVSLSRAARLVLPRRPGAAGPRASPSRAGRRRRAGLRRWAVGASSVRSRGCALVCVCVRSCAFVCAECGATSRPCGVPAPARCRCPPDNYLLPPGSAGNRSCRAKAEPIRAGPGRAGPPPAPLRRLRPPPA